MGTKKERDGVSWLMLVAAVFLAAALFAAWRDGHAETLLCSTNPDYFTKRCTIHRYAVTRVVDGKAHKGHLVGCQLRSYTCMDGVCRDNFGSSQYPFTFSMDDTAAFCGLLCTNPACREQWR